LGIPYHDRYGVLGARKRYSQCLADLTGRAEQKDSHQAAPD
jgi:hypothetical protein